jgi:hypothetical protein
MVGLQICKRPLRSCCFRNQRRRDRNRHSNSGCGDAVPARADTPRDCTDEIFFEKNLRAEISQNARAPLLQASKSKVRASFACPCRQDCGWSCDDAGTRAFNV